MNRTKKLITSLFAAAVLGLAATAQAQDTPPPSDPPPPPPPAAHSSHSSSGDGAGIGIGAAFSLSGVPTAQFVYDQAIWHLEGLFAFSSNSGGPAGRATHISFGAGGWYHFHRGASSDFSLGAALIVDNDSPPGGGANTTLTSVEPGAQIRAFITPNVALHARVGFALVFGDTGGGGTDISLNGQFNGLFGVTYFFR